MAVFPPITVIVGPTASGKSELAFELARANGAQILSADSMQVYKHMDIGTAKPSADEQASVKHHLIDLVHPDEQFTVARFVELADRVIADSGQQKIPLIITGGTPLYYKALFEGLFEGPTGHPDVRMKLQAFSNDELFEKLSKVDPQAVTRIHKNDTRRLIRALEVFELTGLPISSFQTDWDKPNFRYQASWFGLLWDRELLNRRINARSKLMIQAGWLEECRNLLQQYNLSQTASEATGYAELILHLQGKMKLDDAIEQIKISTRQLARRQMKWFKRWQQIHWIDGQKSIADKIAFVNQAGHEQ